MIGGLLALLLALAIAAILLAAYRLPGGGSFAMRLTTLGLWAMGKPSANFERFKASMLHRAYPRDAPLPASLTSLCEVSESTVEGQRVVTLVPKAGGSRRHFLYWHGGSFVSALVAPHWQIVRKLIEATGASVTVPLYLLSPEHGHAPAFALAEILYRQALSAGAAEDIVLAGDSAGANFALGQTLRYRDQGLPLPGHVILFSPWLDLTLSNPEARKIEPSDPILAIDALRLCGQWWVRDVDPRTPIFSPVYADLHGLPPLTLFQGTRDLFVVDARTFAGEAEAAGLDLRYLEYPGAFHVFVGATWTPESQDAFARLGRLLGPSSA